MIFGVFPWLVPIVGFEISGLCISRITSISCALGYKANYVSAENLPSKVKFKAPLYLIIFIDIKILCKLN